MWQEWSRACIAGVELSLLWFQTFKTCIVLLKIICIWKLFNVRIFTFWLQSQSSGKKLNDALLLLRFFSVSICPILSPISLLYTGWYGSKLRILPVSQMVRYYFNIHCVLLTPSLEEKADDNAPNYQNSQDQYYIAVFIGYWPNKCFFIKFSNNYKK